MEQNLSLQQVSDILQVEQSTIRFWEKEFEDILNIKAKKGCHKRFSQKHLEIFSQIKELLYAEMYTIKGARRRLVMDRTLTDALGLESNFKSTVLFMFSAIMRELQNYKEESRTLAEQVRQLRSQKNEIQEELKQEKNKGFFRFIKNKMVVNKMPEKGMSEPEEA